MIGNSRTSKYLTSFQFALTLKTLLHSWNQSILLLTDTSLSQSLVYHLRIFCWATSFVWLQIPQVVLRVLLKNLVLEILLVARQEVLLGILRWLFIRCYLVREWAPLQLFTSVSLYTINWIFLSGRIRNQSGSDCCKDTIFILASIIESYWSLIRTALIITCWLCYYTLLASAQSTAF